MSVPVGDTKDAVENRARRRLLRQLAYVPPAILGVLSLTEAGCQPGGSCGPASCGPQSCNPPGPCGPTH